MKSYYTQQEKLKAVRAHCKAQGATFKKSNKYLEDKQIWHIESRSTGQALVQNLTIDSAFSAIQNNALYW